jgi:hypothetical protein
VGTFEVGDTVEPVHRIKANPDDAYLPQAMLDDVSKMN